MVGLIRDRNTNNTKPDYLFQYGTYVRCKLEQHAQRTNIADQENMVDLERTDHERRQRSATYAGSAGT